jgi:hypothetical protein
MPTHHRIEATIRAPRAELYAFLREPENHCAFHPYLERVVRHEEGRDEDGRAFLRFDAFERLWPLPQHLRIRATMHERVPGEQLRFVSHTEPSIVVISEFHFADAPGGTALVETLVFEAPSLLLGVATRGGLRAHQRLVTGLAAHFEGASSGDATPSHRWSASRRRGRDRTAFAPSGRDGERPLRP